ncbi:WD40 repeat domain-containing protein [Streptomyces sp. NPDC046716]|uniref:WD40 repeat domain-containing protein n=1 Tax=Streptomyces sp. NPDC046716 TaxID=3157093 RepID=UPI0034032F90
MRSPNGQFAAALGAAWHLAAPRSHGRCVVWRIVLSDEAEAPDRIEGPSLGVAFALGLRALLWRRPGASSLRDVFFGLRSRTAVTGALDTDGHLFRVAGMDAKLLAVRRKGFRLVAPEANRLEVTATAPRPGDVRFASTLREADRYARQFRTGRIAVTALALAAVTAGAFALHQNALAQAGRQTALVSQISAQADQLRTTDPSLAARIDIEAYRLKPNGDRYTRLLEESNRPLSTTLGKLPDHIRHAAFSPDGRTLAAISSDDRQQGVLRIWDMAQPKGPALLGQPVRIPGAASLEFSPDGATLAIAGSIMANAGVQLWDVKDPAHPRALGPALSRTSAIPPMAFSPDGHILATGARSYMDEQLWDVSDPAHPARLGGPIHHASAVNVAAFSPNSHTLVTSSVEDGARMWNVANAAHPVALGKIWTAIGAAVFTPDGRTLAIGDGDTVQLLNVANPKHTKRRGGPLTSIRNDLHAMALSPDGHTLATPGENNTLRLWNIANPDHPTSLGPPAASPTPRINSVSFARDGRTVATTGSDDDTVRLWHLPTALLTNHTAGVTSTVFAPNGRLLATTAADNTVRLWNVSEPAHPAPLSLIKNFSNTVISLAFSADGRTLATIANGERRVILWNLTHPTKPAVLAQLTFPLGAGSGVESAVFSPDGHTLATSTSTVVSGGADGVSLWDISDPAHPRLRGQPIAAVGSTGSFKFHTFAFSSDGHTLALAGRYTSDKVQLWDVTDPDHPTRSGPPLPGGANLMTLSPNGHALATVAQTFIGGSPGDGEVKLWDITDHNHPTRLGPPLSGYSSRVTDIAFSPDGRSLATSGNGLRLWNVSDPAHPAPIGQTFAANALELSSLAFAPDGKTLAFGGEDGTVRLWTLGADQIIRQICAITDTPTRPQWNKYLSALPYRPTCT